MLVLVCIRRDIWTYVLFSFNAGKSLLLQVFGPKFDPKFPITRKPCGKCGCGIYPSTGGGKFEEGLDLLASKNFEVRSHVTLIVLLGIVCVRVDCCSNYGKCRQVGS